MSATEPAGQMAENEVSKPVSDVAFTPAVKAVQERLGSRRSQARRDDKGGWERTISPELQAFIEARDSFYLATASAAGRPYVQHRGGRKGFLKVIDSATLAFADFAGNRQYISVGNLDENDQAHIFLMDYAGRQRVKVWGRARVVDDDTDLLARLANADSGGRPERAIVFQVEAWDANCPQHITPRYSEDDVAYATQALRQRLEDAEAECVRLEGELAALKGAPD